MICEHDRLARQCRECANTDDIAELESAHRMMAARNERLQKEIDELAEVLRKAEQYISNGFEFGYIDEREGQTDTLLTSINKVLRKYGLEETN